MGKKMLLTLMAVLLLTGISLAQTSVAPGEGTLKAAIEAAASGDVLELESGGVYTTSGVNGIAIDKVLTIKAVDGAEAMPKLEMKVVKDSLFNPHFFVLKDGSSLVLDNLEFDGLIPDTTEFNAANNFVSIEDGANVSIVKIVNCHLHDSEGRAVDGNEGAVVDTVIIENSIVSDCDGGIYFKDSDLKDLVKVTNSTFANLTDRMVRAQPGGGDAEGIVDHCTVYNLSGKRIIMAKDNNKQWIVTNSIFSTFTGSNADDCIRPGNNEADSLAFCILHEGVGLHKDWEIVADTSSADPMFVDAANGDFSLMEGSPALTMASDGGVIGDPRWAGTATTVEKQVMVADNFVLKQNYPNPFNPSTTIAFTLTNNGSTRLSVYNTNGQLVKTLLNNQMSAGQHEITFNADHLSSGVYFYKLEANNQVAIRKMVLMQ